MTGAVLFGKRRLSEPYQVDVLSVSVERGQGQVSEERERGG